MPITKSQTKAARFVRSFPPEFHDLAEKLSQLPQETIDKLFESIHCYGHRRIRQSEEWLELTGRLERK